MGVPHLMQYVVENLDLSDLHTLRDIDLVIDGNNLMNFLNEHNVSSVSDCCAYSQYSSKVKIFFEKLRKCNIKPYVIFDGVVRVDKEKAKGETIKNGTKDKRISPASVEYGFRQILDKMDWVKHATWDFEADDQIAALARSWNCPVLTNDGDFLLFNIPAGVIPTSELVDISVEKIAEPDICGLQLRKFVIGNDKFVNHTIAPALAVILGNDIFDKGRFSSFVDNLKLAGNGRSKGSVVIEWLRRDIKSLKDVVLRVYPAEEDVDGDHTIEKKRLELYELLEQSRQYYADRETELKKYFTKDDTSLSLHAELIKQHGNSNREFLDWFTRCIRQGKSPSCVLYVLNEQKRILRGHGQYGNKMISSHRCSENLRKIYYGIVLSTIHQQSDGVQVEESEDKERKDRFISPLWQLKDGSCIPNLSQIMTMSNQDKVDIFMKALDAPEECRNTNWPPHLQFLIGIAHYWAVNVGEKVAPRHVHSVMLSILYSGQFDKLFSDGPGMRSVLSKEMTRKRERHPSEEEFSYRLSQFKACLLAAQELKMILVLSETEFELDFSEIYNGTDMYQTIFILQKNKFVRNFVSHLFRELPIALKTYLELCDVVLPPRLGRQVRKIGRSTKKSKKSRKRPRSSRTSIGVIELAKKVASEHFPTAAGLGNIYNFLLKKSRVPLLPS